MLYLDIPNPLMSFRWSLCILHNSTAMTQNEALAQATSESQLVRAPDGWAIHFGTTGLSIKFNSLISARMCLFVTRATRAAQLLLETNDLKLTHIALKYPGPPKKRLNHILAEYHSDDQQ